MAANTGSEFVTGRWVWSESERVYQRRPGQRTWHRPSSTWTAHHCIAACGAAIRVDATFRSCAYPGARHPRFCADCGGAS